MYCVIQKVKNKKTDPYGKHKDIKVFETTFTMNGITKTKYSYSYSEERFERPITDAYKISIHKSYRENGKVKKKQWVICTMSYYSLIESWPGDCILSKTLQMKLDQMGITEEKLWGLVNEKLDPIIAQVESEYETTEEYKTHKRHDQILSQYRAAKKEFEETYGSGEYDYCYDIFGTLRNQEYLKNLEKQKKAQEEYKKSSYQNSYQSNYNDYSYSGYSVGSRSNYTETEKEMLKKIYRTASKKFHPDISNDDGTMMKFLTKLKEQWGI